MSLQHFLQDSDFSCNQLNEIIAQAINIKADVGAYQHALAGQSVAMIFEKPSLRTHVSFDIGINKLGGHSVYLGQQNGRLGERERIQDYAKNLSCWSDAIVARVYQQSALEELAVHASVPVINALSDIYHPCQALADYMSLTEQYGSLSGINLCFVGDGNNVSHSLLLMGAMLGVNVTIITPPGYEPNQDVINQSRDIAATSGSHIVISSQLEACQGQQVIYTDTWLSMGDNSDVNQRVSTFMPYQVNTKLLNMANAEVVMHCQPAHLQHEISTEVFDSPMSMAFVQAENRMWAQSALLIKLLA